MNGIQHGDEEEVEEGVCLVWQMMESGQRCLSRVLYKLWGSGVGMILTILPRYYSDPSLQFIFIFFYLFLFLLLITFYFFTFFSSRFYSGTQQHTRTQYNYVGDQSN